MEQQLLFGATQKDALTIEAAARQLNVSTASIRNWIKTGYLEKSGGNLISASSFDTFRIEIIGKDKLTQRANKSLKDHHDHAGLEGVIARAIDSGQHDQISLSELYENSLSESYRNREGIFYTPHDVVTRFFDYLPDDCSHLVFCDPCCGTGNFLVAAIERGFKPANIYGFDIDGTAIEIARKRLSGFDQGHEATILKKDFLDGGYAENCGFFDVVFTNPPWGKKLGSQEKESLSKVLGTGNSKDTSAIFFFACLKILKESGYLGLLLQDAFFNIAAYESARQTALDFNLKALIDFGKPFKGLLTKARGMVLRKEPAEKDNRILCQGQSAGDSIPQRVFLKNPKSIFNFTCSNEDLYVIEHLLSMEHRTLEGAARWGLGIVTGNNNRYCAQEMRDGYMPVYKGSDITKTGLKSPSAFIPVDTSLYQQVAPLSLYESREKLIYRFISSELVFFNDTEQRYILNSANMLILDSNFPISQKQLCDMLNSRLMSWLFNKLFDTHKVLRTDLESLPVFVDYFRSNAEFSESSLLDYLKLKEVRGEAYRVKKPGM